MLDRIEEHAPDDPSHRMLVGYVLAVVGTLAVGDGLTVIWFPLYTLGLPDSAAANAFVVLFGVGLFVAASRLARSGIGATGDGADDAAGPTVVDGATFGDREPMEVLELRDAEGALSDEEFERRRAALDGSDRHEIPETTERQTRIPEGDDLAGRETIID